MLRPHALTPLVLTCEHASPRLPVRVGPRGVLRELLAGHRGHDRGAWGLTRALVRQSGGSAVGGGLSRLWIDLNRRVGDPELILDRVEGVELPWNRDLAVEDLEARVMDVHAPYHEAIDRLILRRLVRGLRPLVLAVHTFTGEYRGRRRRFDAGVLYDRHAGPAHRLGRALREAGLSVRYNEPYSGREGMMYSADRHGTHHRLVCLELEVRDDLALAPGFPGRLARVLAPALAGISAAAASRARLDGSRRV